MPGIYSLYPSTRIAESPRLNTEADVRIQLSATKPDNNEVAKLWNNAVYLDDFYFGTYLFL